MRAKRDPRLLCRALGRQHHEQMILGHAGVPAGGTEAYPGGTLGAGLAAGAGAGVATVARVASGARSFRGSINVRTWLRVSGPRRYESAQRV